MSIRRYALRKLRIYFFTFGPGGIGTTAPQDILHKSQPDFDSRGKPCVESRSTGNRGANKCEFDISPDRVLILGARIILKTSEATKRW